MKTQTFVLGAVATTVFALFGTPTRAAAQDTVSVTSASQVKAGDGQIAAHGTFSVDPANILMRINVTATKADNPNMNQTNMVEARPDPAVKTDWGATILVSPGTWNVTATIITKNIKTNQINTTPGTGFVNGVVVK